MKLLLAVILVAGCEVSSEYPWPVRAGVPPQPIARADLGLDDTADVRVGDLWLSLHDYAGPYGGADIAYPIVGVPGGGLMLFSIFDRTVDGSHAEMMTTTRFSKDTEPASEHPDRQFATLFIDVELAPRLRSHASGPLANGMASVQLELDIHVPHECSLPPASVIGEATGCLNGTSCFDFEKLVQQDDGSYLLGTLRLAIDVLDQDCQIAS